MSAADPGMGTDPEAGTRGNGSTSPEERATAGSPQGSPDDYEARIRSDPEFALKEVKNQQSGRTRAEAKLRGIIDRIGGEQSQLMGLLQSEGVTGDTLATFVQRYATLRQNPQFAGMLQQFESTGELPAQSQRGSADPMDDDEEYLDPAAAKRIQSLETQLKELTQGLGGLSMATGKAALQSHMEKLRDELALGSDDFGKVATWLNSYVQNLTPNDPTTRNVMRQIQSPDGYETIATLALGHLRKNAPELLHSWGERKRLREQQSLSRFQTDVPSGGGSTGREPPADLMQKGAEDVLQFFMDHPEF